MVTMVWYCAKHEDCNFIYGFGSLESGYVLLSRHIRCEMELEDMEFTTDRNTGQRYSVIEYETEW
jgi:hypothetical protein